ncbi:MAG TPA: xanthine dehydrogenase family protein subunit M [Blastocatellia bacterium]|nr:xanthine dehydrogenase family protein subunit M [Blastocatellia bacterium]
MTETPTAYSVETLAEAYAVLAEQGSRVRVIAGGTDLMVLMNAQQLAAASFLDIWRVGELRGISDEGDNLRIGALTTYTELIRSPLIQAHAPSLIAASRTIGAVQIQNRGTLGGNIVNGSPAGDSLPVLAAYDAELEIGSIRGGRRVAFNTFYTGYRQTVLAADELLVAVRLPKLTAGERDFFFKVGTRRAQAISKVVMAARAQASGRVIEAIRIAIGSVAPTVIRAPQTEALLTGQTISPDLIKRAQAAIAGEVSPITDLRSTEYYRRTVTGTVLAKYLRRLGSD